MRVRKAHLRGQVERHSEALTLLSAPGDMALVDRGGPRLLMFACPDGCGDVVPVNLDPRAGPAWRYFRRGGRNTLYPSVWRTEGCHAHFILWNDVLYWTDTDSFGAEASADPMLLDAVEARLDEVVFRPFAEIAVELQEIPWSVLVACSDLVAQGRAEEGGGAQRNTFRRLATRLELGA